ncbi:MAG: phosphatase PAP2 family protein [Candidatus Thorarchaeota archaeon]
MIVISEKKERLSSRGLMVIGIVALVILVVGIILFYTGLNEAFYSDSGQTVFKIISYLGEPVVFIIISSILFLAYDKTYAKNLALSLLITHYMNQIFKSIFKDPRPAPNEHQPDEFIETSYGFPSGHAQTAVGFWGYIGYEFKDKYKYKRIQIVPCVISVIIFLVAISRIIIGVHDLQDMIGGLLLGIGFLLLFIFLEPPLSRQFNKLNFIVKIIITVIVSVALFLFGTFLFPDAGLGLVGSDNLYKDSGAFAVVGGVLLGFGVGYILEQEYIKYDPSQLSTKKKIINIIIGIILLLVIFVPFEFLIADIIDSVYFRFFRFALPLFVLVFVVPLICKKIN